MEAGWTVLGFTFGLSAASPVVDFYSHLFGAFEPVGTFDDSFAVVGTDAPDVDPFELWHNGSLLTSGSSPLSFATALVAELNRSVAELWPGAVCHAGCVSKRGRAVLLPADPESGKSTLTLGLVVAGFDYLTDEGAAVHPGSARIEPYPKPVSLDPGSWPLFPQLEPRVDELGLEGEFEVVQWLVAPAAIRPDAVSGPCDARYIVFPKYVEGADTVLSPVGRAEALVELAKNTFNFNEHSREYLDQLAVVVRACDCYRLTVGTLDDAVACITELVESGSPAP